MKRKQHELGKDKLKFQKMHFKKIWLAMYLSSYYWAIEINLTKKKIGVFSLDLAYISKDRILRLSAPHQIRLQKLPFVPGQ